MRKLQIKIKFKRLLCIIIILIVITILIFLFEVGINKNITSLFDSIWFLLVTISTVGYGDVYPTTFIGRILTLLLILVTPVLLIQILSLVKDLFAGSLLPQIKLMLNANKNWYIFDELNDRSEKLIIDIISKNKNNNIIVVYKTIDQDHTTNYLFDTQNNKNLINYDINYSEALYSKKDVKIFLTSAKERINNYVIAKEIEDSAKTFNKKVDIYITSNYSYDFYSNNIHIINSNKMITQDLMLIFSKKMYDEKILIVGSNLLAEQIFETLIVNNVYDVNQKNEYYVVTKDNNFKNHYRTIINYFNNKRTFKDKIAVLENLFDDSSLIKTSNIIILCDEDEINMNILNYITKFYPNNALIYVKNKYTLNLHQNRIVTFGCFDTIFTHDNVVNEKLYNNAKKLNNIYKSKYGGVEWNELSSFKKESNVVACNHIRIKKALVDKLSTKSTEDSYLHKFQELSSDDKYKLYEIEHERWCRFHSVYNWEYNELRNDDNRKHNLLTPFNQLSDKDKEKNNEPYECIDDFTD